MSRYKSTIIKKDKYTNNRVLRVTEYPKIPASEIDIVYYTRDDDSFMGLANKFYKDQTLWWVIARANGPYTGNFKFEAGSKLIIPMDLSKVFTEMSIINSRTDIIDKE